VKYVVWVSFCMELDAGDEEEACDRAIEIITDAVPLGSEINITSIEEDDDGE